MGSAQTGALALFFAFPAGARTNLNTTVVTGDFLLALEIDLPASVVLDTQPSARLIAFSMGAPCNSGSTQIANSLAISVRFKGILPDEPCRNRARYQAILAEYRFCTNKNCRPKTTPELEIFREWSVPQQTPHRETGIHIPTGGSICETSVQYASARQH
jgi:hypothetical protein